MAMLVYQRVHHVAYLSLWTNPRNSQIIQPGASTEMAIGVIHLEKKIGI